MQNVWLMGGLSVLTSVPTTPQPVCLLCASKGRHEVTEIRATVINLFVDQLKEKLANRLQVAASLCKVQNIN